MGIYSISLDNVNNYSYLYRDNSNLEIKIGDVWYANIPYADRPGDFKDRPCIVTEIIKGRLSPIEYCVAKCTTKDNRVVKLKVPLPITKLDDENNQVVCDFEYIISKRHFRRKITEITEDELDFIKCCVSYSEAFVYGPPPDYYDRALHRRFNSNLI